MAKTVKAGQDHSIDQNRLIEEVKKTKLLQGGLFVEPTPEAILRRIWRHEEDDRLETLRRTEPNELTVLKLMVNEYGLLTQNCNHIADENIIPILLADLNTGCVKTICVVAIIDCKPERVKNGNPCCLRIPQYDQITRDNTDFELNHQARLRLCGEIGGLEYLESCS